MKRLNKFLGITSLVLFLMLIASLLFTGYYISNHSQLLQGFKDFQYSHFGNFEYEWSPFEHQKSSSFETLTEERTDNFLPVKNIVADISLEELSFVAQDRADIQVSYYSEQPDSPNYSSQYSAEIIDNTLYIKSSYKISDMILDKSYAHKIIIYVPSDYICDNFDLSLSLGDITQNSIWENTKNLTLKTKLGNIDLAVKSPKENLTLLGSGGTIDLSIEAAIKALNINSSFTELDIKTSAPISLFECELDMSSLALACNSNINSFNANTKMSNIQADFNEAVNEININSNVSDIVFNLAKNSQSKIYTEGGASNDFHSDFPASKNISDANIIVFSKMGSIKINDTNLK